MSQLSRPYQIALGVILLLAAAWFLALRPKEAVSEPTPTAPGMTGLGTAVEGAEGAAAASDAAAASSAAAAAAASGETPAPAPAPAAGAPAPAPAPTSAAARAAAVDAAAARRDPSRKVLRWLDRGNVAVVVFSSAKAADDKAVRRALKGLDRRDGRVRVFRADIARVGGYEAITRGISVLQAPTTLVISPDRRARTLVGYFDRAEVQQLVDDVVGASDVELSASVRKQLRRAAGRLCGPGDGARACSAHLTAVNEACAAGRASGHLTGTIEKVVAAAPPAPLAAAHGMVLAALRAELAATPADPGAGATLRRAGYVACIA